MNKSIAIICAMFVIPNMANAEWVRASGSYQFPSNVTEAEACQQADSRARMDAVRQLTGEALSSQEALRCSEKADEVECLRNSTIWTSVGGYIRSTRDRVEQTVVEIENYRKCTVSFEADVQVAQGSPDPNFDVGIILNNDIYRDGEPLKVTIKPSQRMTVQVFQWLPYQKGEAQVTRIFPNTFDTFYTIDKAITIPSEAGSKRYDLTMSFPTGMVPSKKMVDEYLMVVATKTPISLRDSYTLDDFNRVISEIPRSDSRIVRREYNIVRGSE